MQSNKMMFHLILYILIFTLVVFAVGNLVTFYYSKTKKMNDEATVNSEFTKFDLYMLKTIKSEDTKIRKVGTVDEDESSYFITFQKEDGSTYSFIKKGNILYYNQIELCDNVDYFRVIIDRSEKESITVDLTILGQEKNFQYVIN